MSFSIQLEDGQTFTSRDTEISRAIMIIVNLAPAHSDLKEVPYKGYIPLYMQTLEIYTLQYVYCRLIVFKINNGTQPMIDATCNLQYNMYNNGL